MNDTIFTIMFMVVPILVFILILSLKLRGKFRSRHLKATKYIMDELKDDLIDIGTTMGDIAVKTKKNMLDQHEDDLKNMANKQVNIVKALSKLQQRQSKMD